MSTLTSIKISANLVDAARLEAPIVHRSLGGQIEHWASIGRAIENAPGFTLERVRGALEGRFDAGALTAEERVYYVDLLGAAMDDIELPAEAAYWATFDRSTNTDQ